jgi:tetratricopeptide (TPR) repeat protein
MADVSIGDLQTELTHLRNRIDTVAEESQAANRKWYKDISTLISVTALLFSFGTTMVSYKRESAQDIHNLRTELRGILQRLAALPRENMEVYTKYQDPSAIAMLSGYIGQENAILSKQANEVLKRLPEDQVTATDYIAVAQALEQNRDFTSAIDDFKRALAAAKILDDSVGTLRLWASLEMMTGNIGGARGHFQDALDLFGTKYPGYDESIKISTNFLTEINWAEAEINVRNIDEANRHIAAAEEYVRRMPEGPQTTISRAHVAQVRSRISTPNSTANPLIATNPLAPTTPMLQRAPIVAPTKP